MPKILIDIDDTICYTSVEWAKLTYKYMLDHNFKRIKPIEQDCYDLSLSYDIPYKEKLKYSEVVYDKLSQKFLKLLPNPEAFWLVFTLQRMGFTIEFITARDSLSSEITHKWLVKNFKQDFVVHFDNPTDLKADYLIDNSEFRTSLYSPKMKTFLYDGIFPEYINNKKSITMKPYHTLFDIIKEIDKYERYNCKRA